MKMDGYLNEFCKSLKHLIKKGKYKENIQKVQKFIQRQMNNFDFFSNEGKIELFYKQTYCCHQLILKQLMEPKDHLDRYLLIQLIKIASRNVNISYKILLKHFKNSQVIINFENEIYEYKKQAHRISPQLSQKAFSQFLESVIWLVKDFSLVFFLRKDHIKIDGLLRIAISFIYSIEDSLKKKKIRYKLSQLSVKSLYMVYLFRNKQYQLGSAICQKNSTEIFQFISLLSHKYQPTRRSSKYLKKCYKLLLMTFLYQTFFHTALGNFHPLQALISIITKISEIPGPKSFIRRYQNYPKIIEVFKGLIKSHEQLHHNFGNGEILSLIAIKSIIENGQIGNNKLNKEQNIKSKKSIGNKKITFVEKEQKENFQININNLQGRQQNKIKRISGINKSLNWLKNKNNQSKQSKSSPLSFFVKNYCQIQNNHQEEHKNQEHDIRLQNNSDKKQGISFNELWNFDFKNKKLPISNLISKHIVSLYQDVISDNFKDKKTELSQKKLHSRNTYEICSEKKEQFEKINFENDKNKIWGQFKQNVRETEKKIMRQTKKSGPSEYSFLTQKNRDSIKTRKECKFVNFEERKNVINTVRISLHNEIQQRKRVVFSMAEQGQSGEKGKSQTIFQKFIRLLIMNKVNLSIVTFASKYEGHLKKLQNQRIKQIEGIKNDRQNSFKKMISQKKIIQWKPKCKINKLSINKMRSQHIIIESKAYLQSESSKIVKKISSEQQNYRKSRKSNLNCEILFQKQMQQTFLNPMLNSAGTKLNHKRNHYVSKYEKIGEDSRLLAQMSQEQYQKKLKLCYEKSKQSIDDIRKKIIQKQERKQNRSHSSSKVRRQQLAYFYVK